MPFLLYLSKKSQSVVMKSWMCKVLILKKKKNLPANFYNSENEWTTISHKNVNVFLKISIELKQQDLK